MSNIISTKEELILNQALNKLGIETILQYWDGHKHVDIYVPKGKIYIEVDGPNHVTDVRQLISDFQRDHYSDDAGFHTIRISSDSAFEHAELIAETIAKYLMQIAV